MKGADMGVPVRSFATVVAIASLGAAVISPPVPSQEPRGAPAVRLAADAVPLGAIPLGFLRNQLVFCSLICPSIVQLVTTVPLGAAQAPIAFAGALQSGSLLRALGAAAESVTAPADAATTGIITPDVFIVVPKSIGKTLEVAVVQAINVGEAALRPGELGPAVETARTKILQALDEPATFPPSDLPTGAQGVLEVAAVAAISITDAVAFQAGELLLAGVVHTANVAATELANTGDPGAALAAGVSAAGVAVAQAGGVVADAVNAAAADLRAATQPRPATPAGMTATAATPERATATTPERQTAATPERHRTSERNASAPKSMKVRATEHRANGRAGEKEGKHVRAHHSHE
jgi:hypothetical protein